MTNSSLSEEATAPRASPAPPSRAKHHHRVRYLMAMAFGAVVVFSIDSLLTVHPAEYIAGSYEYYDEAVRRSLHGNDQSNAADYEYNAGMDGQETTSAQQPTDEHHQGMPTEAPLSSPIQFSDLFNPALDKVDHFCVPWSLNTDSWVMHHPDWKIVNETDKTFCFQKEVSERTKLLKQIYQNQFITGECSNVYTKHMWSSGLAADFNNIVDGIRYGLQEKRPFQITFHPDNDIDPAKAWHYAALKDGSAPVCPTKDIHCFFLPLSHCEPGEVDPDAFKTENVDGEMASWLFDYAMRPQQWLRRRVFEYLRDKAPKLEQPCAVMHVRRADVVLHDDYSRSYFAIEDYLRALKRKNADRKTILLLTDDQNAIDEAKEFHPDYEWKFLDRKRFRGAEGGWENQLPSKDPLDEMISLLSTFKLAQQCDTIVHGQSGFSDMIYWNMLLTGDSIKRVRVDEGRTVYNSKNVESVKSLENRLRIRNIEKSASPNKEAAPEAKRHLR
jgi:hypothetical protein